MLKKVFLLLSAILSCAVSFPAIFWTKSKRNQLNHFFGVDDPRLDTEWDRLEDTPSLHTHKNILVEWNRLDAQRGAKTFSWIIICLLLLLIV